MHPPPAVFYSWQSDLPSKTNRTLIEDAIEQAVTKLKISAQRSLRLDADTMDEPGSPNIPVVIFSKIPTTAIFVGDVSIVHAEKPDKERRSPNPNVLIELGFAAHAIGWRRIITVMNSFFGDAALLPFDLQQHKFPLTFRSAPEDTERASVRSKLAAELEVRIAQVLASDHLEAVRMAQRLDRRSLIFLLGMKQKAAPFFSDDDGRYEDEIQRLLDARIVYLNPGADGYAYHWTYLGELARDLCHKAIVEKGQVEGF